MSYSGPIELLSAYVDGELPPQQVAELEKQLENDEGLREQLAELKELSQTLQRLPRQSAPDDLKDSVIAAIQSVDRSSVNRPIPLAASSGKSASKRRWYRSPAAIVGSVLTIGFASIWLPRIWVQNGMNDQKLASQAEMAVLEVQPALLEHAPPMEMAATMAVSGGQNTLGFSLQDLADGNAISSADMRPVPVVELTAEQLRQKIAEMGRLPQMGNTIQVPTSIQTDDGEKRIVVVFTVIDVARTLDQLQVLVQNDQIRTLDNRLLSELSPEARASSLSAISLQLDMGGTEMAALLNQVPAVDAMMYLEDGRSLASNVAEKEEAQTLAISRASVPAAPQSKMQAVPVASANNLVQKQSLVQFRFDQLSQQNPAMVRSQAADQQKDNVISGVAARSISENASTEAQPGVAALSPPMQPLTAAKPAPQVSSKVGSVPAVAAKSSAAADHYRAIILIQRAPPVAPAP